MMTPSTGSDWFWSILDAAKGNRERLRAELMGLDAEALERF